MPRFATIPRTVWIAAAVVLLHVGLLVALQTGLVRRAVDFVTPVSLLTEFVTPPEVKTPPAPKTREIPKVVQKLQPVKPSPPSPPSPPPLAAVPDPSPNPHAPTGVVNPVPAPTIALAVAAPAAPSAPPTPPTPPAPPPKVELPSSDADYLRNPPPVYPRLSRSLSEQGKVMVRVQISADGKPLRAEIRASSGFERLDQSAVNAVLSWTYVPGKHGGVPETMWFLVPIHFELK